MMKVAVVGCGVGRAHMRAFQSLPDMYDLVAVCDVDEARARSVAAELGVPRVATDLAQLCAMDDLDVIDLCTPSYLHVEQTLQVLAANKHVICEKPVAGSLKEMDMLMRVQEGSAKRIMPIFQKRFGNGLQKLKLLRDLGITGRAYVATVETHWRRRPEYYATWHGKWQTELGGALVTLAIHSHDMLCYILGPVKSVYANIATLVNPIETEDCAAISLQMADGSLATLSVTTGSSVQISRHRYCFSNLVAESNTEAYSCSHDPWTFVGDSPEIDAQIKEALARFVALPEDFAGEFYRIYQALQNNTELPVTLADARASLELITAFYHSAQTRQPVSLPIGSDHPKYGGWLPSSALP